MIGERTPCLANLERYSKNLRADICAIQKEVGEAYKNNDKDNLSNLYAQYFYVGTEYFRSLQAIEEIVGETEDDLK